MSTETIISRDAARLFGIFAEARKHRNENIRQKDRTYLRLRDQMEEVVDGCGPYWCTAIRKLCDELNY